MEVVGPAKFPVERIQNRWRWHFMVRTPDASDLTRVGRFFMRTFKVPGEALLRITWDRDPVALL
jgi:primosomal protein N' (replication factor Y)